MTVTNGGGWSGRKRSWPILMDNSLAIGKERGGLVSAPSFSPPSEQD